MYIKTALPSITGTTVQYSTVQYSTVQYSTVQHSTILKILKKSLNLVALYFPRLFVLRTFSTGLFSVKIPKKNSSNFFGGYQRGGGGVEPPHRLKMGSKQRKYL